MAVHRAAAEVAQCQACGGVLAPAGDDWRHEQDTGCSQFGTPVICRHDNCGMPAEIGSLACTGHASFLRRR